VCRFVHTGLVEGLVGQSAYADHEGGDRSVLDVLLREFLPGFLVIVSFKEVEVLSDPERDSSPSYWIPPRKSPSATRSSALISIDDSAGTGIPSFDILLEVII